MSEAREYEELKEFDKVLSDKHFVGQWHADKQLEGLKQGPRSDGGIPYLWKWEDTINHLEQCIEALPDSESARRHISFLNPVLPRGSLHTLSMGVQLILPGELAWAHRHAMNAMRFVIDGDPHLYTVVDGVKCPMEKYDLIATPAWTWHDHHNASKKQVTWLDVLDVSMAIRLNQGFYETLDAKEQSLRNDYAGDDADFVQPSWENSDRSEYSRLRFPWVETKAKLDALSHADGSPHDGVIIQYVDPVSGKSPFRTMDVHVQMLKPGEETSIHRHTNCTLYFVIGGEGTTVINDEDYNWGQHDGFCLPNWMWHKHANRSKSEPAYLFSVTDTPALKPLGFLAEQDKDGEIRRIL